MGIQEEPIRKVEGLRFDEILSCGRDVETRAQLEKVGESEHRGAPKKRPVFWGAHGSKDGEGLYYTLRIGSRDL